MKTFITRLLLAIALITGSAAAHLSMEQRAQERSALLTNAEASQPEMAVSSRYHDPLRHFGQKSSQNARLEETSMKRQEPGLMILLGISLISAASYLRRVSHQRKLR